jgi:hypothetical protein
MAKIKERKLLPCEEFEVTFKYANSDGFWVRESRSFRFHVKNRHEQAVKACIEALAKEGKKIVVLRCNYQ